MSILIKDAKAPNDCATCKMPMEICALWVGTEPGIKHQDCPIGELPEKHGRLIDADALAKDYDGFPVRIDPWVWNELSHAPTIIPADKDE